MTDKLKKNDNLLIYYAGHGELDKAENRGYWLPVDASNKSRAKWISNTRIVDRIKATKAKHVLLMTNACFSGTLMRGDAKDTSKNLNEVYIKRMLARMSRIVISAGGCEQVINETGDHSIFMKKFINILNENKYVVDSLHVFTALKKYLMDNDNSFRTPVMKVIYSTGHDGGVFLFMAKN